MEKNDSAGDEMEVDGAPKTLTDDLVEARIQELVKMNQIDFGAWTSLISEIEKTSQNDIRRIRMVYDSFLSEFPLCYGYWKKYAGHVANICSLREVEEVYERAVHAASYSVDIWLSYCCFGILAYEDPADVRRLFERGLSLVGKDYSCYHLWDKYIEFEYAQKQWTRLAHVYISSLRFPTKKLDNYYQSFKELISIWEEEMGCEDTKTTLGTSSSCEIKDEKACEEILKLSMSILDQQGGLLRPNVAKRFSSIGELFYHKSTQIDRKISRYEANIRRPYFHVKPLDDSQLENWHGYLDFVETEGDFDWTVKLYERCLIPCAYYSEFWIRYVEFVDAKGGKEIANDALSRALTVFLKRVPAFHLYCSMFKEKICDAVGALAPFHQCTIDLGPEFIRSIDRAVNMTRRMGNTNEACVIYEKAVERAKREQNLPILCDLHSSFARFLFLETGSVDGAIEGFLMAIQEFPCRSIIQELINFVTLHGGKKQIPKLDSIVTDAITTVTDVSQALNSDDREEISKLFLEFLDLYGTIHEIRKAWDRHRKLFPHIMRPTITWDMPIVNFSLVKSVGVSKEDMDSSPHQTCKDNGHDCLNVHLLDSHPLTNDNGLPSEGAPMDNLHDLTNSKGREELVEVAEGLDEQPIPEGSELHGEANELAHEVCDVPRILERSVEYPKTDGQREPTPQYLHVAQVSEGTPEYPKLDTQRELATEYLHAAQVPEGTSEHPKPDTHRELTSEYLHATHVPEGMAEQPKLDCQRSCPEHEAADDSGPPALANLSVLSPDNETQQPRPAASHDLDIPQEATSSVGKSKHQNEANTDEVSAIHVSDPGHRETPTTSKPNLQDTNSPLHSICDSTPPESGTQTQLQVQSQTSLQQVLPVDVAYSQNPSSSGNWTQLYYVQSSQPQQWQVNSQVQYAPPAAANPQMVVAQGYPYQSQAWTQQANQTVGQYQMGAAQVYPMGNFAWSGQGMQQQAYGYSQSQPAVPPQTQVHQQAVQSNEQQYGYVQNGQGVSPHLWQYYQQQWYYLQQQQQSQQAQNNPQLEQKIEPLQSINPQQQQQNQQSLSQQNQQQPSQQDQQQQTLSPLQNQSHYQQQQLAQLQMQNQQPQNPQQNPHLLYMQQQQQQLYLQQQQQLYLQQQQLLQQQQFQQLPQEQQQLLLQQQQQLLLQQQQQQMLQLQQQQKQQLQQLELQQQHQHQQQAHQQQPPQTSASEPKASSSNLQGEGAKFQNAEQSESPFSTRQATPN